MTTAATTLTPPAGALEVPEALRWADLLPDRAGPALAAELGEAIDRVADYAWWQLMLLDDPAVALIATRALIQTLEGRMAQVLAVPVVVS